MYKKRTDCVLSTSDYKWWGVGENQTSTTPSTGKEDSTLRTDTLKESKGGTTNINVDEETPCDREPLSREGSRSSKGPIDEVTRSRQCKTARDATSEGLPE